MKKFLSIEFISSIFMGICMIFSIIFAAICFDYALIWRGIAVILSALSFGCNSFMFFILWKKKIEFKELLNKNE